MAQSLPPQSTAVRRETLDATIAAIAMAGVCVLSLVLSPLRALEIPPLAMEHATAVTLAWSVLTAGAFHARFPKAVRRTLVLGEGVAAALLVAFGLGVLPFPQAVPVALAGALAPYVCWWYSDVGRRARRRLARRHEQPPEAQRHSPDE